MEITVNDVYPTDVWFEKDYLGAVHIKMQHMAPDTKPFTFITINYNYAYTSNSNQHSLAKEIGKLLGQDDIQEKPYGSDACGCYECNKDRMVGNVPYVMTRMIVCPQCGNKRCPHSTDHNLPCTNSNDPNQPGSRY